MPQDSYSNYELLIDKLQTFIKRYYIHQWVKGVLQVGLIFLSFYLLTSTLEYNLYLGQTARRFIFFGFILCLVLLIAYWCILPLIRYMDNRSRLDNKQAAHIIGLHFPRIQDKLLNILYLKEMMPNHATAELIQASIHQKSRSLVLVPFDEAIDWARVKSLARYAAIPFLICLAILIFYPALLRDSTYRIVNYDRAFAPKAPFEFQVLNSHLKIPQYESIDIQAKLDGKALPDDLNLVYQGIKYPMTKDEKGYFHYQIKSIEKSTQFQLEAAGFLSQDFVIDVVPKPMISEYELEIIPPSYTGLKSSIQKNIGDIQAPEGTTVIWKFKTSYVDNINLNIGGKSYPASKFSNGYGVKLLLKNVNTYTIQIQNLESTYIDSQRYTVSLIPDAHPMISVQEFNDSINEIKYFAGDISDDYGLSALHLIIQYGGKSLKHNVKFNGGKNSNFHLSTKDVFGSYPKGAELNYYFEVWDNDQVNGSKSAKSSTFSFKKLNEKQIEKLVENNTAQIQNNLKKSIKEAKEFQRELENAKKKLLEKSALDFNDKKMMEDLLKRQEELQRKLEDSKNDIQRNFDKKNEITKQDQSILDQQKQLEEMVEMMKSPELQDLLKKINDLLQKGDKKDLMKSVDQMDQKSEKIEKNFDRLLQLYKNLDYKQKLNNMIDKLGEMAKDQKKLSLESEIKKDNLTKQKEMTKEMKDIQKKMDDLSKLNSEVNKVDKKEMEEAKSDIDEAVKEQEAAEKELEHDDKKQGSEKQDGAAQKMDDAKRKLEKLKDKQQKKQAAEDSHMMRRLLENVIYLSFEQEKILETTKMLSTQSPSYPKIIQSQQKLKEDFGMVEDSLYKLASRQSKVRKMIFEEVDRITNNTQLSIQRLVDRRPDASISNEQYAMSGYNKLGLMLSESLKNMNDDAESNSNGQCNNPKKGKKKGKISLEKLGEMQQQLNEQMEKLQKEMKQKSGGQCKSPGESGKENSGKPNKEGKSGQSGGSGKEGKEGQNGNGESKEFARIAAQQQAIRNALKKLDELSNSPDKSGKKPYGNGLQELMDKMNQTEKQLYNKEIYDEMIKRQKEIQVKLLESAKSEREQDEEQRRESEKAKNVKPELPTDLKKYLQNKKQNEMQIQRVPVGLTPYFRTLSEKYFQLIK